MAAQILEKERVGSILAAFFRVYNYYGYGLSEAVYTGALAYELESRGHEVVRELRVPIYYRGRHVTWQRLDMVVDNRRVDAVTPRRRMRSSRACIACPVY